ncbi:MAG TPA: trehalase family glycosidase [Candidatus Saccharimonadales bacterium]|nr:trehalase family glycosidase [Candidatus Saccharimonadales bacterium]
MWKDEYKDCLEYIDNYWNKIIYKPSHMHLRYKINNLPYELPYSHKMPIGEKRHVKNRDFNPRSIKLPHYYFVPNDNKFTYIYYWDSFFMFKGLMGTKREWLMPEMIENFIYLFKQFHLIPNFSAPGSMNRSQPPFFSSMIMDTYLKSLNPTNPYKQVKGLKRKIHTHSMKKWLRRTIDFAIQEYELVWIDKDCIYNHSVLNYPLSRYGDRDIGYAQSSELESGWDMTSRFYNRCDQFLPVDLNSYLYKYETDFAQAFEILNNREEAKKWKDKAEERRTAMQIMWDDNEGFFYDYGHGFQKISHYFSLASYTPLWAGIATPEQAKHTLKHLTKFETPYGLTIGAEISLAKPIDLSKIQRRYHPAIEDIIKPKQWDFPNIWSPLEYLTVIGLLRYGFIPDAKRIMSNSVKTHVKLFRKYKTFFEKIDGTTGEPSIGYKYAMQNGFGWTNAIIYRYIQILDALQTNQSIYKEPKSEKPPYTLQILH